MFLPHAESATAVEDISFEAQIIKDVVNEATDDVIALEANIRDKQGQSRRWLIN